MSKLAEPYLKLLLSVVFLLPVFFHRRRRCNGIEISFNLHPYGRAQLAHATFVEAFNALLVELHKLFLLELNHFGVLLEVVFQRQNEVHVKCFQLSVGESVG